jgi:PKD repeat protein
LASGAVGLTASPAAAVSPVLPNVVNPVPASYTPDVNNGIVYAINQVDSTVYMGGTFTSVSPHASSTTFADNYIAAFTSGTGALVSSFAPTLNGPVETIIPGPAPGEVYVGGDFTVADGVTTHVALLNTSDGSMVSTFKPSGQNGVIQKLVLADGMLFAGGSFTVVGGAAHGALVALNPTTGKVLTTYPVPSFSGHHNYGVNCSGASCADGTVGIKDMDINPAGTQLVAIGNFSTVSGTPEDQVALVTLGTTAATVQTSWSTLAYSAACFDGSFDSYVRAVEFSPDGSYFVVAATGGSGTNKDNPPTNSSCDSAARFESNATGTNVRPTWVDYTGQDTLLSVAITGGVVYVGGHERWLNNSKGHDNPGAGAVPRPSIAALNPLSGVPLSWNPGRNPRGAGTYALFASSTGLYIGSDQDYVGNYHYLHRKIAFFPLAGGETLPADATAALPGRVYSAGGVQGSPNPDQISYRHYDGTTATAPQTLSTGIAWGSTRGAFIVNGEVIYGKTDGSLDERSFDGSTFGPEVLLDPWNDPNWDSVQTGSGQTYQGAASTFSAEIASVTSMFFTNGRLYYTLSNSTVMHWRWFEPESGIVGSDEFTVTDGQNWSGAAGAFLSGNTLYFAKSTGNGNLMSLPWNGTQVPTGSTAVVADSSQNWAGRGMFLLSDATNPNLPPVASFTASCSSSSTVCTFDASASHDPDGSITQYAWAFGNNPVQIQPNGSPFTHDFTTPGHYTVSLTVTDNSGATTTQTQNVVVGQTTPVPAFGGATTGCGTGKGSCGASAATSVAVPPGTAAGDALLLYVSWPTSGTVTAAVPSGWNLLGTKTSSPLESDVYYRTASSSDLGANVPVTFSAKTHNSVTLADYKSADPNTIEASASSADANTASHVTPTVNVTVAGSLAVSYWADKSSTTTAWTPPAPVTQRATFFDTGGGYTTSLLADSNSTVGTGSYGGLTATTNAASGKGTEWTVILAPAGTTNSPPVASFTSSCSNLSCSFDASGSTDSSGTITTYAWTFGDGNTSPASASPAASNVYATGGTYPVTLTVTDTNNLTGTATKSVTVSPPVQNIGFVGFSSYDASGTSGSVKVPAGASAGDTLLLFESHASTSITAAAPAGWTLIGSTSKSNLRSAVYEKTAVAGDANSSVAVTFSASVKAEVTLADYTNTAAAAIETALSSTATATDTHVTPAVSGLSTGSWVVSFWTDKSTTTTAWTAPGSVTVRQSAHGTASAAVSDLLADSNAGVSGSYGAQSATSNQTSGSAAQWTIALAPAS